MTVAGRRINGRIAALAIFVLLLVVLLIGPGAAYLGLLQSGGDQIDRQTALLQRYRSLAEAPRTAAAQPDTALMLPEIPDSQAVARLQETLKSAAVSAQVQVQGFQILRAEPMPGAVKIGVRLRGSGDATALGRLLYAIETTKPLLVPDNLQVQAHAAAAATDAPGAAVPLDFQFDVSGFKVGASS